MIIIRYTLIILCFFAVDLYAERVVSLAPSITEVIYELGGGDRLVGVTSMCDYPPKAKDVDKIGSYFKPNLEKIISLKPDIVLGMEEGANVSIRNRLNMFGVENHFYTSNSLDDVLYIIKDVGDRLHLHSEKLTKKISDLYSNPIKSRTSGIMIINIDPVIAIGGGVFINDILRCGGFENLLEDNLTKYPRISLEAIYKLKPEYVLYSKMDSVTGIKHLKSRLDRIGVKTKYVALNPDIFNRASYRIADACMFLRENVR